MPPSSPSSSSPPSSSPPPSSPSTSSTPSQPPRDPDAGIDAAPRADVALSLDALERGKTEVDRVIDQLSAGESARALRRLPEWQKRLSVGLVVNLVLAATALGATIAAYVLAFATDRPRAETADDVAFVMVSYLGAFAPFQALDAADYIGPKWKSVRETRRVGRVQYVVGICGMATVVLYTDFQRSVGDFKEMAAAILVLLFSVLSLMRTSRGLMELAEFKRWAVVSIDTLRRKGIVYAIDEKDATTTKASELADRIMVNETVVDNRLSFGRTMLRFPTPVLDFGHDDAKKHDLPRNKLDILEETKVWAVVRNAWALVQPPLLPTEPVETWLDWAVAFAAQGLTCWLRNPHLRLPHAPGAVEGCLCCAPHDDLPAGKSQTQSAQDLLDAQALQCRDAWKADLIMAMGTGAGLPFGAPHLLDKGFHDRELIHNGYRAFEGKLARVVEGLPPDFGTEIHRFDRAMLERLTVVLSGGLDVEE